MRALRPVVVIASLVAVFALSSGACGSSNSSTCDGCDAGSPVTMFVGPYGSCTVMDGYAPAAADDCPGVSCKSGTYFAICDGTQWVACDCARPDAGALISDPNFSGAPCDGCDAAILDSPSGDDVAHLDAGTDADEAPDVKLSLDGPAGG